MSQSIQVTSPLKTLVSSPSLKLIEADLAQRGLNTNTRQLFLHLWRAKTQPKKLPLGLIFKEGTLAQELHVSVRTIQRSLQTLVDAGLLRIQPRVRPDGGATSNRYFPTWRPAPVAQPTPARAPLTLPIPNENEPAQEAVKIAPDTVFVWPILSGGPTPDCQGGVEQQTQARQAVEGHAEDPIDLNPGTFSKSDQQIPGGPVLRFDSEDHLRLFLFAHLKTRGITPHQLTRWIRQYGLPRIVQIAIWILSAPKGAIRNPGGWMEAALADGWDAPLWVRTAREKRIKQARVALEERASAQQEIAEGEKLAMNREQDETLWTVLAPHLQALPNLYAYAADLARAALKSTYSAVFKPGSATERTYVLQAAKERPDLWQGVGLSVHDEDVAGF